MGQNLASKETLVRQWGHRPKYAGIGMTRILLFSFLNLKLGHYHTFSAVDALTNSPYYWVSHAGVAKSVYAPDSKSGEVTLMSVRVRPPALQLSM